MPTGDAVLIEVARRLHECLRRTDTAARLGGDEFALLLPEVLHPREAELIAQRVVEALAAPVAIDGRRTCRSRRRSGSPARTAADVSAALLLRNATDAAKEAREAGSGDLPRPRRRRPPARPTRILAEELSPRSTTGSSSSTTSRSSSCETGRILGAEALVRWQHPVRGLIAPLDFLPVASGVRA